MVFSFSKNRNLQKEIENKDNKSQRGKDMKKWGRNKEPVYTLKGSLRESEIVREREIMMQRTKEQVFNQWIGMTECLIQGPSFTLFVPGFFTDTIDLQHYKVSWKKI